MCRNSYLKAVRDTPIARITGCVLIKDTGRRLPLELSIAGTTVNRVMVINLCTETIKPDFERDKMERLWKAPVYYAYPVVY